MGLRGVIRQTPSTNARQSDLRSTRTSDSCFGSSPGRSGSRELTSPGRRDWGGPGRRRRDAGSRQGCQRHPATILDHPGQHKDILGGLPRCLRDGLGRLRRMPAQRYNARRHAGATVAQLPEGHRPRPETAAATHHRTDRMLELPCHDAAALRRVRAEVEAGRTLPRVGHANCRSSLPTGRPMSAVGPPPTTRQRRCCHRARRWSPARSASTPRLPQRRRGRGYAEPGVCIHATGPGRAAVGGAGGVGLRECLRAGRVDCDDVAVRSCSRRGTRIFISVAWGPATRGTGAGVSDSEQERLAQAAQLQQIDEC